MTTNSQFDVYAAFYDLLYNDKNYKGESEYIDTLINKFLKKERRSIALLDLACGTGRHLQELEKKGYGTLSGSDISKSMIEIATKNAIKNGQKISFFNHSFQESDQIMQRFDVVISMFSAVNYLTTYEDQSKTFNNVYKLLNKDGLFIFDYWNGCAVTQMYSPIKVLKKKEGDNEIVRISETRLNLIDQSATVKFICSFFNDNMRISEFEETHLLHYYFFSEMKNLLASHKFEILCISPFMKLDQDVTALDWNITIVARKLD